MLKKTSWMAVLALAVAAAWPLWPQSHPAAAAKVPEIVCFGDSLTAGYGVDPGKSYPDLLQRGLDQRGYHYKVINMGVSGETTQDGSPAWRA